MVQGDSGDAIILFTNSEWFSIISRVWIIVYSYAILAKCDFNGDWRVNNNDSTYLTNLILEGKTDVNKQDVNGDWKVDVTDIMICVG